MNTIKAWHFLPDSGTTRYSCEKVEAGKTYSCIGKPELCKNGMHACINIIDALSHAPGALLCRVELSGTIVKSSNKLCAKHRKVWWMLDATKVLNEFACICAEQALKNEVKAGRTPDPRSYAAIQAKRDWLAGKISHIELSQAHAAAHAAAASSASSAASSAASAAYYDAYYAAYYAAAYYAASSAASSAAYYAAASSAAYYDAYYAAKQEQNKLLESMIYAAKAAQKQNEKSNNPQDR